MHLVKKHSSQKAERNSRRNSEKSFVQLIVIEVLIFGFWSDGNKNMSNSKKKLYCLS